MNIATSTPSVRPNLHVRSLLHVLALVLLFAHVPNARATTVIAPGFTQMVSRAERIVTARVSSTRSDWAVRNGHRCILTTVRFEVERTHKGSLDRILELEFLGGTVGTETMEVKGVPSFHVGERVLLFAEKNGKQFCPLVGIYHGKLVVEHDPQTGADIVLRHNRQPIRSAEDVGSDSAPQLTAAGAHSTTGASLPLKEFVTALEQELSKGGQR